VTKKRGGRREGRKEERVPKYVEHRALIKPGRRCPQVNSVIDTKKKNQKKKKVREKKHCQSLSNKKVREKQPCQSLSNKKVRETGSAFQGPVVVGACVCSVWADARVSIEDLEARVSELQEEKEGKEEELRENSRRLASTGHELGVTTEVRAPPCYSDPPGTLIPWRIGARLLC